MNIQVFTEDLVKLWQSKNLPLDGTLSGGKVTEFPSTTKKGNAGEE